MNSEPVAGIRRFITPARVFLAFILVLGATAAPASAGSVHDFLYTVPTAEVPRGTYYAEDMAVDNSSSSSSGDVYLASGVGDGNPPVVDKFDPSSSTASYLCQITGEGETSASTTECDTSAAGPGRFGDPRGVAVDPSSGFVYVAVTGAEGEPNGVYQFEPSGAYTGRSLNLGGVSAPHLDVSNATGNVLIADETNDRIIEWNPGTESVTVLSTGSGAPGGTFESLRGVAVDNDPSSANYGDVYAVDGGRNVIDRFSEAGVYECQITGAGEATTSASECDSSEPGIGEDLHFGANEFKDLAGAIAVDPTNGHIYVGEGGGFSRVDEFAPSGSFLAKIGEPPPRLNQGWSVAGISISKETGDIFVASDLNPKEAYVFGPDKPIVASAKATEADASGAVLHGTVNPAGTTITACEFEYVEAAGWEPREEAPYASGSTVPCEPGPAEIGTGTNPVPVEASISGLEGGKIYHFRLVASNSAGTSVSGDEFFGAPEVNTRSVTQPEQHTATLNATVNPDNIATTYKFEYGTSTSYGKSAPASPVGVGSGKTPVTVSQPISGLQLGTTYHYRVVATNASGTVQSPDRTFETLPAALLDPIAASPQSTTAAILQAYVDPLGAATSYHFEYGEANGPAGTYGNSTPTVSAGEGNAATLVSAEITGLQPGSTYHFRTVVANANGTITGPDVTLETEAASCPNEARREEQGKPALMLPECRAFEQVSPQEKGGADAFSSALGTTGEHVFYKSRGSFAGNEWSAAAVAGAEYLAHRTASGWVSEAIHPTTKQVGLLNGGNLVDQNGELTESLWGEQGVRPDPFTRGTGGMLALRQPDGTFVPASPPLQPLDPSPTWEAGDHVLEGSSADFTHFVYRSDNPFIPDNLPPGSHRLYDIAAGPSPSIALIQVDSAGKPIPQCETPPGYEGGEATLGGNGGVGLAEASDGGQNAISADGSTIFFSLVPQGDCSHEGARASNVQIYARLNQSTTVPISEPPLGEECESTGCRAAPPQDAVFAGAAENGSKAFLLDTHMLTDEASEDTEENDSAEGCMDFIMKGTSGCNLYMYDFARPEGRRLVDISASAVNASGPEVRGVLRSSEDGSHVYFVAHGLLTEAPNSLGQRAQAGAENLYVYDTETGGLSYIGFLCSGEEKSGSLTGIEQCQGDDKENIWTAGSTFNNRTFSSPNGEVFVFSTFAQLTPDDTNANTDVYRYDAATGSLERVSIGHDGTADQNGNGPGGAAAILWTYGQHSSQDERAEDQPNAAGKFRPMSNDGASIVFTTKRALQEGDENGKVDYYLWHDGQVSLVSGAKSNVDLPRTGEIFLINSQGTMVSISPSGRDITFATDAGLVNGDNDGLADIYDARIGGGFAPPPPPPSPCEGNESCGGPPTQPGPAPTLGSETLVGPQNPLSCHKGFVEKHNRCVHKKHRRKAHRRHHSHNKGGK